MRIITSWTPTAGSGASSTIQMPGSGRDLTSALIGITPSARPTFANAAIARSRSSRSWAALICVRMRAWPFGTTGKKKPIT